MRPRATDPGGCGDTPTAFELEVGRIAASEGVTAPRVIFRDKVEGTAASAASGRQILVDARVPEWGDAAQRWLAAHEMRHIVAHSWRAPHRWAVGLGSVVLGGLLLAGLWLFDEVPGIATLLLGPVVLSWFAATSWVTRRIEDDADRYAARAGYRGHLQTADLFEFLTSDSAVPLWRSTHRRWADRLGVRPEELPEPLRRLRSEVAEIGAELATVAATGWSRPYKVLVAQRLPGGKLTRGLWPSVVVASRELLASPPDRRRSHLQAAMVESRRTPGLRACALGLFGVATCTALAAAAVGGASADRAQTLATVGLAALLVGAVYEIWRRSRDRRLSTISSKRTTTREGYP